MNGQWIGPYTGANNGSLLVNVDDRGSYFEGVAYVKPENPEIPTSGVGFRTTNKDRNFQLVTRDFWAIHPYTGNTATWEEIKPLFPTGFSVSNEVEVTGAWDESHLEMSWKTDIGTSGTSNLPRSRSDQPSDLTARSMVWEEYKRFAATLGRNRHLFRGQSGQWRLRTAFHRTGRADLRRFVNLDIGMLHRRLSLRTKHIFDLQRPEQNGAFFNLVQHHGYPTPLLDWTYSPYVAAFFAFRGVSKVEAAGADPNKKVRIIVLDERWITDIQQLVVLDRAFPHFSITEFIAIENERMIPQQSVSSVTNVDDIETYIRAREEANGRSYLFAIDLPRSERSEVFDELSFMGLTAGSLFPGLDGACEELKERNF